jgi:hypothetical protein
MNIRYWLVGWGIYFVSLFDVSGKDRERTWNNFTLNLYGNHNSTAPINIPHSWISVVLFSRSGDARKGEPWSPEFHAPPKMFNRYPGTWRGSRSYCSETGPAPGVQIGIDIPTNFTTVLWAAAEAGGRLSFCCFLAWITLEPWRWRQRVPRKRRLISTGLHEVISQKRPYHSSGG